MADRTRRWTLFPFDDARGLLRSLAITLAAGLFLAIAGAFGTGEAPMAKRLAYWLPLMLVGWFWGVFVARHIFAFARLGDRLWLRVIVSALIMAAPLTAVVLVVGRLTFGTRYAPAPLVARDRRPGSQHADRQRDSSITPSA